MIFWSSRGLYGPPLINFLSTRCNVKWDLLQINTRIGDIRELQRLEKGDDQDFYDHSVEDARCRWNHKLVDEWVKEQKSKSKMSEKDYVDATKLQVDDGLVVEISDVLLSTENTLFEELTSVIRKPRKWVWILMNC